MAQWPVEGDVETPVFDADEFNELSDMIGEDGVLEMVWIFETETRARLERLAAGGQDTPAIIREMHTLKGAAGTVASPRLAALGRTFEAAAKNGGVPSAADLATIKDALDAFLAALKNRVAV